MIKFSCAWLSVAFGAGIVGFAVSSSTLAVWVFWPYAVAWTTWATNWSGTSKIFTVIVSLLWMGSSSRTRRVHYLGHLRLRDHYGRYRCQQRVAQRLQRVVIRFDVGGVADQIVDAGVAGDVADEAVDVLGGGV